MLRQHKGRAPPAVHHVISLWGVSPEGGGSALRRAQPVGGGGSANGAVGGGGVLHDDNDADATP